MVDCVVGHMPRWWLYPPQPVRRWPKPTHYQAPFTRYNLLSNRFDNRFDKRLYRVYSRLSNRVVQPVWQPVVSCKRGFTNPSHHHHDGV